MLLSTAKRFVRGYKEACLRRTGQQPDRNILLQAFVKFAKALKINQIPL